MGRDPFRPPEEEGHDEPLELAVDPRVRALPAKTPEPAGAAGDAEPVVVEEAAPREIPAWAVGPVAFLLAIPAAFLPRPWRRPVDHLGPSWGAAQVVSGGIQIIAVILVGSSLFAAFYEEVGWQVSRDAAHVLQDRGSEGIELGLVSVGPALYIAFFLSVKGFLLLYFFVEGLVRAAAGAVTGEALATLPLWIAERGFFAVAGRIEDRRLGKRVPDEVEEQDGVVWIKTCRPRDWDHTTTLSVGNKLYTVAGVKDLGQGPRRFLYKLVEPGPGHLVRRVRPYDPNEVLHRRGHLG